MDSETSAAITTAPQTEDEQISSSEAETGRQMVNDQALDLIEKVAKMQLEMKESQAVSQILDYAKQVDEASDELSKNIMEINEQLELVNTENSFLKLKLLEMEKNLMERTIAFGEITEIKDQHVKVLTSENDRLKATLKMVMERIRNGDFDDIKAAEVIPDTQVQQEIADGQKQKEEEEVKSETIKAEEEKVEEKVEEESKEEKK